MSLWAGFNLAPALTILFILLGRNAPCLLILYGDTPATGLDPRALATINALAVLFNACAAAICALSLSAIWLAFIRRITWAFWSLAGSLLFLQASGFASDGFLGNKDLPATKFPLCFCFWLCFSPPLESFARPVTVNQIEGFALHRWRAPRKRLQKTSAESQLF